MSARRLTDWLTEEIPLSQFWVVFGVLGFLNTILLLAVLLGLLVNMAAAPRTKAAVSAFLFAMSIPNLWQNWIADALSALLVACGAALLFPAAPVLRNDPDMSGASPEDNDGEAGAA